ncbi:2-phosphosulfolactate phosphatase [Pseudactinotalea suaedae]|uniref:2-phosphosulfolactate phosphatase n=1 Tax=Pseudactinotalea suaedae TaxID=1524924 RepID=UPI00139100EB|nr:2-phosphosulfolactate phosphatase [Pseudactinotalea suaedae]
MEIVTRHVDDLEGAVDADVAVVIDVIRAFTVAPWCLSRGAERLLFAPGVEEAVRAQTEHHPEALLLKDGGTDPRFALPNAPGRIAREDLTGRTVIQVTGNGTRGAYAAGAAPVVLCASFATAAATARAVRAAAPARLLLMPTEGDEDVALADYLVAMLDGGAAVDPSPYLERVVRSTAGRECAAYGADARYPGVDADNLRRCLEVDVFDHALQAVPQPDGLLAVHAR